EAPQLPTGFANSLEVALGVVTLNLLLGTLAAYTFARERFRGRQAAYTFVLGSRLLPAMAVAIPIFLIIKALDLLDTKLALVLIYSPSTLPFTIWVLTLYFQSLPRDIEEAALVDGCNRFRVLWHVVLPLAAPGLAAIAAFSFLFSYNEFLFALLITSSTASKTVPVMIAAISVNPDASYTLIAVGIMISVLAPMALAVFFRRFITSGLVASIGRTSPRRRWWRPSLTLRSTSWAASAHTPLHLSFGGDPAPSRRFDQSSTGSPRPAAR